MNTEGFFKTLCPKCGKQFAAPLSMAGQSIACPYCEREMPLPAEPPRADIIKPTPPHIPAEPRPTPRYVQPPGVVTVLNIVAALELVGGLLLLLSGSVPLAVGIVVSAILMFGLARLIISAHESAERLAHMEVFLREVVNQRK